MLIVLSDINKLDLNCKDDASISNFALITLSSILVLTIIAFFTYYF